MSLPCYCEMCETPAWEPFGICRGCERFLCLTCGDRTYCDDGEWHRLEESE